MKKSCNKTMGLFLITMVVVVGLVLYFGIFQTGNKSQTAQTIKIDGIYLPTPKEINDFTLADTQGNTFTKANLKGHWTLMFFGFTNCALVCPTTMAAVNKMYQALQSELPADKMPKIVMVSVDPDRDTVARMKSYVTSFNPNFLGARAGIKEITALEKQLNIVAVKIQTDGKGKNHYTIDHSAEILVFNPNGQLQAYLSYPHKAEQMVQDYKLMLSQPT